MTIRHSMLPPDVSGRHDHGWTKIAEQLADELTASATMGKGEEPSP